MTEKFFTLCIDLEEYALPEEFGFFVSREDKFKISLEGANNLCGLLERLNVKATFFSNQNMAQAFPEFLKSLADKGHEIALHSVTEDQGYDIAEELRRQKEIVEGIIQKKIYGCRFHKLVYFPADVLRNAGLIYDNSSHPTFVPGRYCNIFSSRRIHAENGVIRIPISVTPLLRLPFSWIWFRNLGLNYAKFCSNVSYLGQEYVNIYFHSWDFANIENWPLGGRYRFLVRNTGEKALSRLNSYLNWYLEKRVEIITMSEYIKRKDIKSF